VTDRRRLYPDNRPVPGFAGAPAAAAAGRRPRPRPGAVPGDDALADWYEAPLPLPDGDILAVGDRTTTAMVAAALLSGDWPKAPAPAVEVRPCGTASPPCSCLAA
jgi:hypothetical protein